MTVRLNVQRERWWRHVTSVATETSNVVPVVMGNAVGFGRVRLAGLALEISPIIAVGTIYELDGLPATAIPVVLTPTLVAPPDRTDAVLTVGHAEHIDVLRRSGRRVIVDLATSGSSFGGDLSLLGEARRADLSVVGVSIRPPRTATEDDHLGVIRRWLPLLDPSLDVWVGGLSPDGYRSLPDSHRYRIRLGRYLWLGDREAVRLTADVVDARPVRAGTPVGEEATPAPGDGHVVLVGAGRVHGIRADAGSPFRSGTRPLTLVGPPGRYTSVAFVPDGDPSPRVGEWVDVTVAVDRAAPDEVRWH